MSLIKGMWVCLVCCSVGLACCVASFDWEKDKEDNGATSCTQITESTGRNS
jgi:hypothetical protein